MHPTLPSSQKRVLETWYGGQLSVTLAFGKMRQEDCHKFEASFDSTVSSRVAWLLYETLPQKTQGGGGAVLEHGLEKWFSVR